MHGCVCVSNSSNFFYDFICRIPDNGYGCLKGFDVEYVPQNVRMIGLIHPRENFDKNPWFLEQVEKASRMATEHYNAINVCVDLFVLSIIFLH